MNASTCFFIYIIFFKESLTLKKFSKPNRAAIKLAYYHYVSLSELSYQEKAILNGEYGFIIALMVIIIRTCYVNCTFCKV